MADIRGTTDFLDDFERPPETPLSGGGNWAAAFPGITGELRLTTADPDGPVYDGSASNNPSSGPTALDYSYWTAETFDGNDIEIWGYPEGGEAGAALTGWRLGFFVASTVPGSGFSGYLFLRATALGDFMIIRKYSGGGFTDIGTNTGHEGYKPLLLWRRIGTSLEAWHCTTEDGSGTWTLIASASDGDYTGPWKLVIGIEDGSGAGTGWGAIGGPPIDDFPQIYRRPNE